MASTLQLRLLFTIAMTMQFHHVDSHDQLSTLATGLSKIIKLLEDTSASFIPNLAVLIQSQNSAGNLTNTLLQNNTDILEEMSTTLSRIEEVLKIQHSVFEMQNQQLDNISSVIPHIVSLLEKQQNMQTLSHTPTIVETTNAPITQPPSIPIDCSDISAADYQGSGVYTIYPKDGLGSFQVYCNMDTDGGGWTVFQKRFDGSVDFFLGWRNYEEGFGNVQGEHWLGLQQLHRMTSSGQWKLRIDMEDFNGYSGYAQYEDFQIGNAASFYQLSIGDYSGTAGHDALSYHNGAPFSTKDSDHDTCSNCQSYDGSCALSFQGAWWYYDCHQSNLNALYQGSTSPVPNHPTASLMTWYRFSGSGWSTIKKSEMKMRRVQ